MKLNRNGWITSSPAAGSDSSDDEEVEHLKQFERIEQKKLTSQSAASNDSRKSKQQRAPGSKLGNIGAIQIISAQNQNIPIGINANDSTGGNTLTPMNLEGSIKSNSQRGSSKTAAGNYGKMTLEEPVSPINAEKQDLITPLEMSRNDRSPSVEFFNNEEIRTLGHSHRLQNLQDPIAEESPTNYQGGNSPDAQNYGRSQFEADAKIIYQSNQSLDLSNEMDTIRTNDKEALRDNGKGKKRFENNIEILREFQASNDEVTRPISPIGIDKGDQGFRSKKMANLAVPRQSQRETGGDPQDSTPLFKKNNAQAQQPVSSNTISDSSVDQSNLDNSRQPRKSNESGMRLQPPSKKAKEGVVVLQQSKKFTIDAQNHPSNLIIPHFSDAEISEAFKTLDLQKKNYITAQDLSFFLNVLETDATEGEIEEMIRMLDYEGTGRVYYPEFYKLATGKSLNPIGQAYPPTTELLMKKKANDAAKIEEQNGNKGEKLNASQEVVSKERPHNATPEDPGKVKKAYGANSIANAAKNTRGMRIECFQNFISAFKIGPMEFRQIHSNVKKLLNTHQPICKYVEFLEFLGLPRSGDDYSWNLFNQITAGAKDVGSSCVDIREIIIGISACLSLTLNQKLEYAFELFDIEGSGSLVLVSILKIFQSLLFGEDMTKIERKIRVIIKKKGIGLEDYISKEDYFWLASQYPNLFIVN